MHKNKRGMAVGVIAVLGLGMLASAQTRMSFPTTRPFGLRYNTPASTSTISRPNIGRSGFAQRGTASRFSRGIANTVRSNTGHFNTHKVTNDSVVYFPGIEHNGPQIWNTSRGHDPRHDNRYNNSYPVHNTRGSFSSGHVLTTGVGLHVGYADDNLRLSFHSGLPLHSGYGYRSPNRYECSPYFSNMSRYNIYSWNDYGFRYPRSSYSRPYPNDGYGTAQTQVIYVGAVSVDPSYQASTAPNAASAQPPAQHTQQSAGQQAQTPQIPAAIVRASNSLRTGDTADAIDTLRNYISLNGSDVRATRALALALIDNGDVAAGVSLMALAYERQPTLASSPIDGKFWLGGKGQLRDVLRKVSGYANSANTPAGWTTLAILMQAEGRHSNARQMLQRAIRSGLSPRVGDPLFEANNARANDRAHRGRHTGRRTH